MHHNIRLASYTPKGKETLTMKQQKAVLIASRHSRYITMEIHKLLGSKPALPNN